MRKINILLFSISIVLFIHPRGISAEQLIIKDDNISETVLLDHFTMPFPTDLFLDLHKVNLLMDRLEEQVYKQPKNARFDQDNKMISAKTGKKLDRNQFIDDFYSQFYLRQEEFLHIPKREAAPRVDDELLESISKNKIHTYTTMYQETNKERSQNIKIATAAIDSYVLFPGESFSFNKVVGQRTEEKGYKRAPVIVKGELAEDIGGGICQVSSTLFNAVNLKGIQMIERYSHSREVPYVPPGKDATVSWWGQTLFLKMNITKLY
ncbi:VanW family protein [Paracerasibacillus soli]|uniref:VanW family protein n=1 Tax=Paracerasibacillus soli TaxID=480284 RepID=A0ABU5CNU1_9BACI|nr:VanW family protein [Virgibacillus soli]MDY0408022.1 VanW family protein [Virgibacillus soli]